MKYFPFLHAFMIALSIPMTLGLVSSVIASQQQEWEAIKKSQAIALQQIESLQMEYVVEVYFPDLGRKKQRVKIAVEDGMYLNSSTFDGKFYQRADVLEGADAGQHYEVATLGGSTGAENRTKMGDMITSGSRATTPGKKFAELPQDAAGLSYLARLHDAPDRYEVQEVRTLDDGQREVIFRVKDAGATVILVCDPQYAFLPTRFESRTSSTTAVTTTQYQHFKTPDGSRVPFPVAATYVVKTGGDEYTQTTYQADVDSIRINEDIDDSRFYISQDDDDMVVRQSDRRIVSQTPVPRGNAADAGNGAHAHPLTPEVYESGWVSVSTVLLGVGVLTGLAALVLFLRGRRA